MDGVHEKIVNDLCKKKLSMEPKIIRRFVLCRNVKLYKQSNYRNGLFRFSLEFICILKKYIFNKKEKKVMKKSTMSNFICIALMGLLLVLQFMPFWNYDGMSTSIQSYIWSPLAYGRLDEYIAGHVGGTYVIDQIIAMPILVLVIAVAGIILCIWKSDNIFTTIFPLACGSVGVWGYLCKPAFQLGTNWVFHLVVCIAMIVAGILRIVFEHKEQ